MRWIPSIVGRTFTTAKSLPGNLNWYTSPNTKSKILGATRPGTPFPGKFTGKATTGEGGVWFEVLTNSGKIWVATPGTGFSSYFYIDGSDFNEITPNRLIDADRSVSYSNQDIPPAPIKVKVFENIKNIPAMVHPNLTGFLNLRATPSTSGKIVTQATAGQTIGVYTGNATDSDPTYNWFQILLPGGKGLVWVAGDYLADPYETNPNLEKYKTKPVADTKPVTTNANGSANAGGSANANGTANTQTSGGGGVLALFAVVLAGIVLLKKKGKKKRK